MSNSKQKNVLRMVAILIALLSLVMQLDWVRIPALAGYSYWMMTISFAIALLSSR